MGPQRPADRAIFEIDRIAEDDEAASVAVIAVEREIVAVDGVAAGVGQAGSLPVALRGELKDVDNVAVGSSTGGYQSRDISATQLAGCQLGHAL